MININRKYKHICMYIIKIVLSYIDKTDEWRTRARARKINKNTLKAMNGNPIPNWILQVALPSFQDSPRDPFPS